MKVKLDEDLPEALLEPFFEHGYSAATVRQQHWNGLKDPVLWIRVCNSGEFFVTGDKEFGDIRKFPPGSDPGILLLRPNEENTPAHRALIEMALKSTNLMNLSGKISVANPRGLRIRD